MTRLTLILLFAQFALVGCAKVDGAGLKPQLASEGECRAAAQPERCKKAHDLAGGYPFTLDSGR